MVTIATTRKIVRLTDVDYARAIAVAERKVVRLSAADCKRAGVAAPSRHTVPLIEDDSSRPLRRAHAVLTIKRVDEGEGLVTGIATTVSTDYVGDIVEPGGAVFKLPLPFLLGHNTAQPLGTVVAAEVTDKGISITARIAKGLGVPFIDDAWKLLRAGLIRGLSIGFKGLDVVPIKGTGGLHFKRWTWLETSAVVLPANSEASIVSVRACDRMFTAVDYAASPLPAEVTAILQARAALRRQGERL